MKKTLSLLCMLAVSLWVFAQGDGGVYFRNITFSQALNEAKTNKKGPKMVFLDCYTTWCGPCKHMAENIFPKEEAGKFFNAHFVNIKIDMEKGEGVELAKKYRIAAYPTFLVLDADGNEIGRIVGGGELLPFIEKVKKAMDPANSPMVSKAKYEETKTFDHALAYLNALDASYMNKEIIAFMNEHFNEFKTNEKWSEKMWKYVAKTLSDKDSKILSALLEEKSTVNAIIGKEKTDNAIIGAYKNKLLFYLMGRETLSAEEVESIVLQLNLLINKDVEATYLMKMAKYYSQQQMDKIIEMYNAQQLVYNTNSMEQQLIERAFAGIKEMPKENIEKYYQEKEKALTQMATSCNGWKEMFIKNK